MLFPRLIQKQKLMFVDSHAHLTSDAIYPEVDQVLERAKKAGVEKIVNICTDLVTLERGLELNQRYPWVYNSAATTPHDVDKWGEAHFETIEAARNDLIAIGETGLDYYYEHSPKELQKKFLKKYLQLATECVKPVIIHCREAFGDLFEILDKEYAGPGVLHCFTGTLEEAKEVVKRKGWYLSLSGIVTFKKSVGLQEVARLIPLDKLLIETDSPYLAPQPFRGKTNEPGFIRATANMIAEMKGVNLQEVADVTSQNAKDLFKL